MAARVAPYKDAIKDWLNTGVAPNYCMWGRYMNYIGDNGTILGSGKGANWQQIQNIEAHQGQPLEVIMAALSLSLGNPNRVDGLRGVDQHIYLQVPLCPNNGTYLPKTVDGTNDHYWTALVAAINAAGLDHKKITWVLGWEFFFGNIGSFQWSLSSINTFAVYKAAFRQAVAVARAAGFTGSFMADMTGGTVSQINAGTIWPGDDVCDMVGYHAYNGTPGLSQRTDIMLWWNSTLKPVLDACTNFARAHGKLCGASELALIVARYAHGSVAADTSSNTYLYHTADTALYWPLIHDYVAARCDVWAGLAGFFQDQASGSLSTEFNADLYLGANPATQAPEYPHDTSQLGTIYDTVAAEHSLSNAAHVRSIMVPGTMQIATATPAVTGGGGGTTPPRRLLVSQTG